MLNYDSEDIGGMDDDAGDDQEPAPTGHGKASPTHDVYMVDTPKGSDNEEKWDVAKDNSPNKQPKRRCKRRPKTGLDKNGTHMDPALEQGEAVDDAHVNKQPAGHEPDKQPIPGEDDLTSLEHMNLHTRLFATARSLKKQKQKLKTAEDALRMRWSKVLNSADKHGASHQTKSYPKRKLMEQKERSRLAR